MATHHRRNVTEGPVSKFSAIPPENNVQLRIIGKHDAVFQKKTGKRSCLQTSHVRPFEKIVPEVFRRHKTEMTENCGREHVLVPFDLGAAFPQISAISMP